MPTTPRGFSLGCHPNITGTTHPRLATAMLSIATPAASVDVRPHLPPVWDQGQTSACTAYGTLAGFDLQAAKQGAHVFDLPSFTFTYAFTRIREGTFGQDAGANIMDAVASMMTEGVCASSNWPNGRAILEINPRGWWAANHHAWDTRPPMLDGLYEIDADPVVVAKHHRATTVRSVPRNGNAVRMALTNGFGIILGINVYTSFEDGGDVPLPNPATEQLYGGHCVFICGYRPDGYFICRNSWGQSWSAGGYCYLHPDWFDNPAVPLWDMVTVHAVAKG